MKIYMLTRAPEGFQILDTPNESDFDVFRRFDGTPRGAGWVPVRVAVFRSTQELDERKPTDYTEMSSNAPVFSLRACEGLRDILEENGEILPLLCDEGDYVVYNVTSVSDALDEERSLIGRSPTGRIIDVEKYEFRQDRLGGTPIFRLTQIPRLWVFVTEEFVQRVQELGLVGLHFIPVWEG